MKLDKKAYTLPYMEMYGGETRSLVVTLTRSDGTYYSYSTASELAVTLTFSPVKATSGWGKFAKPVSPVLTKTATISVDSSNHGIAVFDFTESDTKELRGKYIYQIEVESSSGDIRVAQGHLYIKRNINSDIITSVVYYTVTFIYEGEEIYTETVKRRKKVSSFPTVSAPSGYDVAGWYDVDTGEEFTEDTPVTKDTTVEPEYECNHSLGTVTKAENLVSPTCTGNGKYESATYCSTCGEELSRTTVIISPTGHTTGDYVIENYVAPTCTTDGSQDIVYYCTVCGEEVTRTTETLSALGHTAADAVSENATEGICTEGGSYDSVVYCSVCGEELSRTTVTYDAQGHQYVEVVVFPTCTEQGYTTYTCSVCGDTYTTDYTDATGHNYVAVVTAPTCTEAGYTTYTCSNCGEGYIDDITSATGHSYVATVVSPTCTEQGYTVYVCEKCGDEYFDDYVSATGHVWDDGEITTEPTCTEAGVKTYTCTTCGETKTETISATGHTTTSSTSTVTEATCTEAGSSETVVYCTVCGEIISTTVTAIPATGHSEGESKTTSTTAATCTEAGSYTVVVYCATCGEAISTTTYTIEATGHTEGEAVIENYVEPTYSSEGSYDEVVYCETCGEELSRTSYTIDKLVTMTDYGILTADTSVGVCPPCAQCGDYAVHRNTYSSSYKYTIFDESLTMSSVAAYSSSYFNAGKDGAPIGDYALFASTYYNSSDGSSIVPPYVETIDSSLSVSKTSSAISSARVAMGVAHNNSYAFFAGGANIGYTSVYTTVDAYNSSLTRSTLTALPTGTYNTASASTEDYAIFGFGATTASTSSYFAVAYGTDGVRTTLISPSASLTGLTNHDGDITGDYIIFGTGGGTTAYVYNTALTYQGSLTLPYSTWLRAIASLGDCVVIANGYYAYEYPAIVVDSSATVSTIENFSSPYRSYGSALSYKTDNATMAMFYCGSGFSEDSSSSVVQRDYFGVYTR